MDGSLKAALGLALVLCVLRGLFHAAQAIHPIPMTDVVSEHIDDAGGYGILAAIICYAFYRGIKKP